MFASKYAEPASAEGSPRSPKRGSIAELPKPTSNMLASKFADPFVDQPPSPAEAETKQDAPVTPGLPASPTKPVPSAQPSPSKPLPDLPSAPAEDLVRVETPPVRPASTKVPIPGGKQAVIRVPTNIKNRIPPLNPLSEADVNARFESFKKNGFDISGYGHTSEGLSRDEYPDPQDVKVERKQGNYTAAIPDQRVWEAYVTDLREQKLRALGVSSGDDELSSAVSRTSPHPSGPLSPPPPVSSSTSQHPLQSNASFRTFSPITATSPPIFGMPGLQNPSAGGFMPRTAGLKSQSPFTFGFPNNQSTSPAPPVWPGQQAFAQNDLSRGGSPSMLAGMQSFASLLSPSPDQFIRGQPPMIPARSNGRSVSPQFPLSNQLHIHSGGQEPVPDANKLNQPSTPRDRIHNDDDPASNWFVDPGQDSEIANPTPRGHRHNISANLEREAAENAEYYPGEYVNESPGELATRPFPPPPSMGFSSLAPVTPATDPANHKPTPSTNSFTSFTGSKLNVEAPEFKFEPGRFRTTSMSKNMFMPSAIKHSDSPKTIGFLPASVERGLNVAAPAFQPGQKEFPFTAASFDFYAAAPTAGTPAPSMGSTQLSSAQKPPSSTGTPASDASRIFSQIDFSEIVKPTRKSKAVPIVAPEEFSTDGTESEMGSELDSDGRVAPSIDRQKRPRQAAADGDDVPLFALPNPNGDPLPTDDLVPQPELAMESQDSTIDTAVDVDQEDLIDVADQSLSQESKASEESKSSNSSRTFSPGATLPELIKDIQSPQQPSAAVSDFPGSPTFQEIDAIMEYINNEGSDVPSKPVERLPQPATPLRTAQRNLSSPKSDTQQLPSDESDVQEVSLLGPSIDTPGSKYPGDSRHVSMDLNTRRDHNRPSASPVRLNSPGKIAKSDWDDVVSSDEEEKFKARSPFFNSHVTNMIDGLLKHRLDPLEKRISEMGEFTRVPLREFRARGRPSFAEQSMSDADDEDDTDTGTHNRPQSHRNDRKAELIKAAVLEAMTSSQNPTFHRIEDELSLRYAAERREADTQRMLKLSEEELELYRKSTEDADNKIQALETERKEGHRRIESMEKSQSDLRTHNSALAKEVAAMQATLEEYRLSSTRWREELDEVNQEKISMEATIDSLNSKVDQHVRNRQSMSEKLAQLQLDMSTALGHNVAERTMWQKKDEEHSKNHGVLLAKLEGAAKVRDQLEQELQSRQSNEADAIRNSVMLKETQNSNARLEALTTKLTHESLDHQKMIARLEHEASIAQDNAAAEVKRMKMLLEADVEVAMKKMDGMRVELETRLEMARNELTTARQESETMKGKADAAMAEAASSRANTIREAAEASSDIMHEERAKFDKSLEELAAQNERALKHALEDKKSSETRLQGALDLANAQVEYLNNKVSHLEDKVSVAQSAAQAAASAAQTARAPLASMSTQSFEKVSPKALRESIVVLQEQLHEREMQIEQLEQKIATIGEDAPLRIKEKDTEIGWLRELLGVRLDDLSELVDTLSQPEFDRDVVRHSAIRIRSSLQMEQHEKERLISGSPRPALPTLADIQNFASPRIQELQNYATPRAAQIAAAWGNWRKGKEPALTSLAQAVGRAKIDETPSKPSPSSAAGESSATAAAMSSAQSFMSGLITPPATDLRKSPSLDTSTPAPAFEPSSRPLKKFLNQTPLEPPKTPTGVIVPAGQLDSDAPPPFEPTTPPLLRTASYDQDAELTMGSFDDDEDDAPAGDAQLGSPSPKATRPVPTDVTIAERTEIEPFGPIVAKESSQDTSAA